MLFRLRHLVVACLAATACVVFPGSDFPDAGKPFVPPPQYRVWWEVVEACSGRRAPFEAITWFKVPVGELVVRRETAAGAWFVFGNRIAIVDAWFKIGPVVRHEMLHAILETGDHPKEYFRGACGDEVACSDDCQPPSALHDAVPLSVYSLEADAVLFPARPSLTAYEGKATVVVRVRNPAPRNAYFSPGAFSEARCAFGFMLSSVADPRRTDMDCYYLEFDPIDGGVYFRPGETRRLVFEVDLRVPTYGGRPFSAEPVTLSAIVGDNIRRTVSLMLLP